MEDLSKKTVFITGITGFTGVHLENFFLNKGCNVFGTTYQKSLKDNYFVVDITNKNQLKKVFESVRPDYIIHTAAISFVAGDNQNQMYQVNVFGTLNLLDAIIECEIQPEKIVIASSAAVYGNIGEILSEEMCPQPVNHYGNSKLVMENMVKTYFSKLNIIITRPFNYTGVGQAENFLIPKIAFHFKNRKQIIELGNIDVYREFNDVDYLINCYYRLLISDYDSGIVNVCTGKTISIKEILSSFEEVSDYKIDVRVNRNYVRKNEIKTLKGSPDKMISIIGNIVSKYKFKDTIIKMYQS